VVFLGWDGPTLPRAAALLLDRVALDGVADFRMHRIVLPGARAGRRLLEILIDLAEERGVRLVPPRTLTPGSLPEDLYVLPAPRATTTEINLAWIKALGEAEKEELARFLPRSVRHDGLRDRVQVAAQLVHLHATVAGAGAGFREVARVCARGIAPVEAYRWRFLAALQERALSLLDAAGLADVHQARVQAEPRGPEGVTYWLLGVTELLPATRRLLDGAGSSIVSLVAAPEERREDFDSLGCVRPERWIDRPISIRDSQVRLVDRPADQGTAIREFLRSLGTRYRADQVVLGISDETMVPHLERILSAAEVPTRFAVGADLSRSPPVMLLSSVSEYLDRGGFGAAAALLRHPDLSLRREGAPLHAWAPQAADRYFRRHLPRILSPSTILPGKEGEKVREAVGTVEQLLAGFRGGARSAGEWMDPIMGLLRTVYGSRELQRSHPRDRAVVDACSRIRSAASELHQAREGLAVGCTAAEAIRLVLEGVKGQTLTPESLESEVEILGWLELPLDDAPVLAVAGFNEPHIPASVTSDPFLPNSLRKALGLPDDDLRYARDAFHLQVMASSREALLLVAGRRTAEGDPLRPSRLLFADSPPRVADRLVRHLGGEGGPAEPGERPAPQESKSGASGDLSTWTSPPEPRIQLDGPLRTFSVTDFSALIRDPYRFVLERVLRLEPEEDDDRELDAASFGSLAHEVLEKFGASPAADSSDEGEIRATLRGLLERTFRARFGSQTLPAVQVQKEHLRFRLEGFARWQAGRRAQGWRITHTELRFPEGVPLEVDGEEYLLRGKIDRADHHPELGWAILDYKTSETGRSPEENHRKKKDGVLTWIDLQLPLYRYMFLREVLSGGSIFLGPEISPVAKARETGPRPTNVEVGYVLLPRDIEEIGPAMAGWSEEEMDEAVETARTLIRSLREGVFQFDPEKSRAPWPDDPLEALLGFRELPLLEDHEEADG
jgi:hypothetical protein